MYTQDFAIKMSSYFSIFTTLSLKFIDMYLIKCCILVICCIILIVGSLVVLIILSTEFFQCLYISCEWACKFKFEPVLTSQETECCL